MRIFVCKSYYLWRWDKRDLCALQGWDGRIHMESAGEEKYRWRSADHL